jgi:hypothetical protein
MRTTIACFALALTASACIIHEGEDGPGTGNGSGSGSGSGSGGGSVTPHSGRWFYDETTPVSSNCPGIINQAEAGDFRIEQSTSAGFRVEPEDGTAPFPCTLSGTSFDCPERASDTQDYRDDGFDAVVTIHATAQGTFSSPSRASGRQDATVSCTGTQCNALAAGALPCHFTVDFVIQAFEI